MRALWRVSLMLALSRSLLNREYVLINVCTLPIVFVYIHIFLRASEKLAANHVNREKGYLGGAGVEGRNIWNFFTTCSPDDGDKA
jgi:hypothetical protein